MNNVKASSSESWLSNITISGNNIKANVAASTSDSRNGSVTISVNKSGGGTCQKTMTITQKSTCPHADETINILIYRSSMPPRNSTFYLLDAKITESTSDETKEWIINNGYQYTSPSDIFEDLLIGKYDYVGCDVSNFITNHKYCSISSGSYSNKKLEVGVAYYCYQYRSSSNQWIQHLIYEMPTAEYCQEHVQPFTTNCYVITRS
jgi:hypothetical protein